jgi:hypothetical protein
VVATADETLADERGRRTQAAAIAIAAGALMLLGALLTFTVYNKAPTATVLETLRAEFREGPQGLVAQKILFFHSHAALVAGSQVIPALAVALVGCALVLLYRSTRARNPAVNKLPLIAAIAGAVLVLVPTIVSVVTQAIDANTFANAAHQTDAAARDVRDAPLNLAGRYLAEFGSLTVGLAFVLTALNAMKVGLLTRFMGVLGVIVGVLFVIPLEGPLPIVRVFWMLALGALFLGRWPGGMPPAWVTGEAQPWPTQQEIREARTEARSERKASRGDDAPPRPRLGRAKPPETPAPEAPASKPHPASKKKKRKRH